MEAIFQTPGPYHAPGSVAEKLLTTHEAAEVVGAHYWQLQRAIKRGDIPSYTPFNSRRLVKLSEVVAYINSCRQGGAK
jgi:excisionase family DNA binding protein